MIVGKSLVTARSTSSALESNSSYARLVLRKKDGQDIVVSLRHRTNLVGSADGCRVRLRSKEIAPLHAVITRDPTGLQIRRLDPDGRLELNAQPIDVSYLRDGDKIRVGPVSMRLSTNLKPIESKALLEEFAEHVKNRLRLESDDWPAIDGNSDIGDTASGGASAEAKTSEAVHRWQHLTDQLEEQEQLLSQVEERLQANATSSDPGVCQQVHQLSELHERIRNEIAVLRLWLRPKALADQAPGKPADDTKDEPPPERPTVALFDSFMHTRNAVGVEGFVCRICGGSEFTPWPVTRFEILRWLCGLRRVACCECGMSSVHFVWKIQSASA